MPDGLRCPNCGARVYPGDHRCMECGFDLRAARSQSEDAAEPDRRAVPDDAPVAVDCPVDGCSGRIRMPTMVEPEGRTICPLCHTSWSCVTGTAREVTGREVEGGGLGRWQIRYEFGGHHPDDEPLGFVGHGEIEVEPGDRFVLLRDREGDHVLFCNLSLEREWETHAPRGGCFPAVVALALCCAALLAA